MSFTYPKITISVPKEGSSGFTGTWRTFRPVINLTLCKHCGICAMYCPDAIINCENIDLRYCKGCGICANECPTKCIQMVKEYHN
ncbi:MAG TPA: 4Fe-4S binding protein [Methanocorpusculum sp.]|nr:4Fe-4S binding protein [Methanocorpusculum sp.]